MMSVRNVSTFLGAWLVALALSMCDAKAGTILIFGQTGTNPPLLFAATQSGPTTTLSATDILVTITNLGGVASSTNAFFSFSATNSGPATVGAAGQITENFQGSFSIFGGAGKTGTDYLSGTFSDTAVGVGTALTFFASSPGSPSLSFTSEESGDLSG